MSDFDNDRPITELYAIVSRNREGNEGICSIPVAGGEPPFACGYPETFLMLKQLARIHLPTTAGIYCVKYTNKVELGEL